MSIVFGVVVMFLALYWFYMISTVIDGKEQDKFTIVIAYIIVGIHFARIAFDLFGL